MLKKLKPKLPDTFVDEPSQPLGEIGRALWDAILTDRDLNERERELLFQACVASQRAADLGKRIEQDGMIIESATGRMIEHPGIRSELHYRALATRCLTLLKPQGPGSPGRPAGRWYEPDDE